VSLLRTPTTSRQVSPFIKPVSLQPTVLVFPIRSYAADGASAVEAPDYLDEAERKIFDTLQHELQPTKLEVCYLEVCVVSFTD